jgi:AraC-like DNA-binding protein
MPAAQNDFAIMRFSTDALPERDRVPMLRDVFGPLARLDIEPAAGKPLHFTLVARAVPDLGISTMAFSAVRAQRTRALIADGNDNCLFSCVRSPGNTIAQRGHEVAPAEGSGTLLSLADPFACTTAGGLARALCISVPRKVLAASVPRLEDGFGHAVPNSEALRMLVSYVGLLENDHLLANPDVRRLAVVHVHDLVALAFGAARDAAEIATGRGLRAARLHAIKTDIRASLGEQGLSLTAVAVRHGVTTRHVQSLFAGEGSTFSQFLLSERLARVHQMLRSPLHMARSTSAIAYDAGFGDLSHFNRDFRRRYGATPSDVRAAAKREMGQGD